MFNRKEEYYQKNKKHILQRKNNYNKLYRKKKMQYDKEYRIKNREKRKIQHKIYYEKNKRKAKKYYEKNRNRIKIYNRNYVQQNLLSWEEYIPKETFCEICNRRIYFNNGVQKAAIHFDHQTENVLIKRPTTWLRCHKRTLENQKIWEKCAFGMLCKKCNGYFPTKDRLKLLNNIIKYIKKGLH